MESNLRFYGKVSLVGTLAKIALLAAFAVPACGKNAPYDLNDVSGDHFSDKDRGTRLTYLKDKLNANIVVEDQSYGNEYLVNRIERFLAKNADQIGDKLKGVVEIRIGTHFSRKEISEGKLSLSLDSTATDKALKEFIDQAPSQFQIESSLKQAATRGNFRAIVDMRGMTIEEANGFSSRLLAASKGYDFTVPRAASFCSTIVVDQVFAVGSNHLIVPYGASEEDLRKFLGAALELSKTLGTELEKLGSLLAVSVTYQPGVLMPAQITQGIASLRAASDVFLRSGFQKKSLMIGRRAEGDTGVARDSSTLLVAFDATPADIQAAIGLLGSDGALSIRAQLRDFTGLYQNYGVTSRIAESDFTFDKNGAKGEGAADRVRAILTNFSSVAGPTRLSQLRITEVSSGATFTEALVEAQKDGTAILRLNVNALNADQLNAAIQRYTDSFNGTERVRIQKRLLDELKRQYGYDVSIEYIDAGLDTSAPESTLALEKAVEYFRQIAPATRLRQLGIKTVTFSKGALTPLESVIRSGASLSIDPYTAKADILEQKLQPVEHEPALGTGRN